MITWQSTLCTVCRFKK